MDCVIFLNVLVLTINLSHNKLEATTKIKWEYKCISNSFDDTFNPQLNQLVEEGWEIFKLYEINMWRVCLRRSVK